MLTGLFCIALVLLSKCGNAFSKNHDLEEKFEEHSITSEIVGLLNGTYFNINEKVCQLQRRVDAIEGATDVDNQCECNKTAILEFKRSISNKIKDISKVLSGFENEIRVMKKEHAELFERLGRGDSEASTSTTTTTTTTAPPRACDNGWILSPKKCYFVSSNFQKTEWTIAIFKVPDN
ncbi:uncharacterized protein LOC117316276 [Pecten maximus]|uniref:uncharacterized protein LOC117316276 n=1 Tax=Pecten maximus TaxID=6579 RepID=UPI001458F790|nr:uncharacterized protein LOC117316276 [Pecten maximus]